MYVIIRVRKIPLNVHFNSLHDVCLLFRYGKSHKMYILISLHGVRYYSCKENPIKCTFLIPYMMYVYYSGMESPTKCTF
jgi:hypothetical protein